MLVAALARDVPRAVAGHRWMWPAAGFTLRLLVLGALCLFVPPRTAAASFHPLTMFCHVVESHAPETACGCRYVILGFKGLEPYIHTCRHNSAWCKVKFHN